MTENEQQSTASPSAASDHLHCWHWKSELTEDHKAEAQCCFVEGHTTSVDVDNPVLRGEHGPYAQSA